MTAPVVAEVTAPLPPTAAFEVFTEEIGMWWRRDAPQWNDRHRGLARPLPQRSTDRRHPGRRQRPFTGRHTETPLHWAASSDDVAVLDALLDAGADIEADGGVGKGSPLADAVAFAQWNAARRLIERGAQANLWQAAGLGLMDRIEQLIDAEPAPTADEITNAFWCACRGGQQAAAAHLLDHGADLNWVRRRPAHAAGRREMQQRRRPRRLAGRARRQGNRRGSLHIGQLSGGLTIPPLRRRDVEDPH